MKATPVPCPRCSATIPASKVYPDQELVRCIECDYFGPLPKRPEKPRKDWDWRGDEVVLARAGPPEVPALESVVTAEGFELRRLMLRDLRQRQAAACAAFGLFSLLTPWLSPLPNLLALALPMLVIGLILWLPSRKPYLRVTPAGLEISLYPDHPRPIRLPPGRIQGFATTLAPGSMTRYRVLVRARGEESERVFEHVLVDDLPSAHQATRLRTAVLLALAGQAGAIHRIGALHEGGALSGRASRGSTETGPDLLPDRSRREPEAPLSLPGPPSVPADALCRICGDPLAGYPLRSCPACETPHHAECWSFLGGCSTYACGHAPKAPR